MPLMFNMGQQVGLLGNPAGSGQRVHRSLTGYDWSDGAAHGVSNVVDVIAKPSNASGTGGRAVIWDSLGTATSSSTNHGTSWSAGGSVVTGLNAGCYFPLVDLFILAGTNLIYTSPDAATWTARTAANSNNVGRVVVSPNEALITSQGSSTIQRSTNGTTWSSHATPTPFIRLSYNAVQGLWLAHGFGNGKFYTSPTGITWTEVAATVYTLGGDICAFGRYWVTTFNDGAAHLTDDGLTFQKLNIGIEAKTNWTKSLVFNDMLILAQRTIDDGDTDVFDEIDFAFSAQVIGI
jgi:hypothetical protein